MAVDSYGKTVYDTDYDYDEIYRRRLARVREQGQTQTAWEKNKSLLDSNKAAFDENMKMRYAGLDSMAVGANNAQSLAQYGADLQGRVNAQANMFAGVNSIQSASSGLQSFINAIGSKESGGNYSAVNRHSGALGKYQIMPANIPSWSRQALGRSITPSQFLASPEIQERVAQHQLASYYHKYGPAGAAIAWYAGPGAAQAYARSGYASTARQGQYPSINSYAQAILRQMGLG